MVLLVAALLLGQSKPAYYDEVQAFKVQDAEHMPEAGQILFVGSSSFTKWKDIQAYFPRHRIINRGFGGSTLLDVIHYENDVIFPYNPKQVVIYCGENDLAADPKLNPDVVASRFFVLFEDIRRRLPGVPVVYVSMKPSPSRINLVPKYLEANAEIRTYLAGQKGTSFVDVVGPMLRNGSPKPEIFGPDRLHMNAKGYAIWAKLIEPKLVR